MHGQVGHATRTTKEVQGPIGGDDHIMTTSEYTEVERDLMEDRRAATEARNTAGDTTAKAGK